MRTAGNAALGASEARRSPKPLTVLALAAVGVLVLSVLWFFVIPTGSSQVRLVDIATGTPVIRIAHDLKEAGIIRSETCFMALARLTHLSVKAGEYGFKRVNLIRVLRTLSLGRVHLHRILVREGDSIARIAVLLGSEHLADPARFRRATVNKRILLNLGVPADSAEGYLFPDTYLIPRNMGEERILALMVRRFFEKLPRNLAARAEKRGMSLHRAVTFASIVEREARVPAERVLISAVFHNRLRRGMPLQADPTVLYALGRWDEKLAIKDLLIDHPYNTYRRKGLPPGPICSPGLACLIAAVEPAQADYLYFVTRKDGSGRHEFSKTLKAHENAIKKSKERVRVGKTAAKEAAVTPDSSRRP